MAEYEDLLEQASEIRDADQEKENTATRVGTMLVNVIKSIKGFVTNNQLREALESLSRGIEEGLESYAKLNLRKTLLDWDQSPIVVLASMGSDLDNIDGADGYDYTPKTGDLYYRDVSGYQIFEQKGTGAEGKQAHVGVVYINARTLRCYQWDGEAMVAMGNDYNQRTVIDDMETGNLNSMGIDEMWWMPGTGKLAIKTGPRSWYTMKPNPKVTYTDKKGRRCLIWDSESESWIEVGGGQGISEEDIIANLNSSERYKALSASMGMVLKQAVLTMYNALSNSAFTTEKPPIEWGVPMTYRVTYKTLQHCSGGNAAEVTENNPFAVTLEPEQGYSFAASGASVVVTMGGVDITANCMNKQTGELAIPHVTGNVVIVAIAAMPQTFGVTTRLSRCASNAPSQVTEGSNLLVRLTPDTGYALHGEGASVSVTMGGTDITQTAYNAASGQVMINGVTADIVISATAVETSDHEVTYDLTGAIRTSGVDTVADGDPLTVVLSRDDNAAIGGAGWGTSGGLLNRFKATDVLVMMGGVPLNTGKDAGFTVSQPTDKGPITINIASVTGQVDIVYIGIIYDRYLKGDDSAVQSSDSNRYTYPHIPIPPNCSAIKIFHNYINNSNGKWAAVIYDNTKARTASVDLNGGAQGVRPKTTSIVINLAETAPSGHNFLRTSFYDLNVTDWDGVADIDGCYIYDLTNKRWLWAGANAVEPTEA